MTQKGSLLVLVVFILIFYVQCPKVLVPFNNSSRP